MVTSSVEADDGPAGQGGEAVQVVGVDLDAERHGEEGDVGLFEAVAEFDAAGLVSGVLLAALSPSPRNRSDLLPAAASARTRRGPFSKPGLEVDGAGAVLGFGQRRPPRSAPPRRWPA